MKTEPLESNYYYHVYNRANGTENLFLAESNYLHFLVLMKKHLVEIVDIYSYCLLPNHFHLLVRVKENVTNPSQAFSNLFNAYTKAINKQYNRHGSLFQRPFKRIKVSDESYLKALVVYIHTNPELHGVCNSYRTYVHSSFPIFLSKGKTALLRQDVINWFHDLDNFILMHDQRVYNINDDILLE